jgi:protein subunit release factor B
MIEITHGIAIDESETDLRYVCASGPGGQNVNALYASKSARVTA